MADSEHKAFFTWPSTAPDHVVLTGSFDNWSSSVTMTKTDSRFEATVALPWDEEVVYKYIVDGQWVVSDQEPKKDDGSGQLNNVYRSPKATEPAGAADAPTATPEVQPETVAAPVIVSETAKAPTSEVKAEDQFGKEAETAASVLPPLVDILPLATEVRHTTDVVPEATVGPSAAAPTTESEDAASLSIVEVLPSQDALPSIAPVEGAITANESVAAAVEATPTPAIEVAPTPALSTEAVLDSEPKATPTADPVPESSFAVETPSVSSPDIVSESTAVIESAPVPSAEVVPESAAAVEATPTPATDAVPESTSAASVSSADIVAESTAAVEVAPTPSAEVVPESVVAIETPTPAVAEAAPVPSAEILLESTASAEAAPAPTPSADAQVVPESAAAVETMSSPAPTAELAPVAAAESAPAPAPAVAAASGKVDEAEPAPAPLTAESETIASKPQAAVVSDAIAVPVSESTATKVDAAVAPAEAAVEKPTESVAVPTTDDKPVATTSTPEAKPRLNGPVKGGADRRSRTISALKGKLFPTLEDEKLNGTPEEDGKAQNTAPPATATPATNIPPREQRKSIFGRIASIFRTSS